MNSSADRTRGGRVLLLAGVLLAVLASTLPPWGTAGADPEPKKALALDAAERFRLLSTAGVTKAREEMGLSSSKLLDLDARPAAQEIPSLWPYYFAGAFTLGGYHDSSSPLTAYYNPLVGIVLFVQWEKDAGGTWRPVRTTAKSDRAFLTRRATRVEDQPLWFSEAQAYPTPLAIQRAGMVVLAAFAKRHPASGKRPPRIRSRSRALALELAEARMIGLLASLGGHGPDSPSGKLEAALRSSQPAALASLLPDGHAPTATALKERTGEASKGFRLLATLPSKAGHVALYIHPALPLAFYGAHIEPAQGGAPRISQLVFLEYNHAYAR